MGTEEGFGLNDVLLALSLDLEAARQETAERGGGFGLDVLQAEIELTVAVTRETKGAAGGKVKVLAFLPA
jgi:hypothetical protein